MSRKCDRGVDPEFRSNPELMSTDPLTMKGFEASADVGWPMNHVANRVSAGPSAMEVMADHWLPVLVTVLAHNAQIIRP